MTQTTQYLDLDTADWSSLTYEEKNRVLFLRQKRTLDEFLERGAITREQYEKSLSALTEKMGAAAETGETSQ